MGWALWTCRKRRRERVRLNHWAQTVPLDSHFGGQQFLEIVLGDVLQITCSCRNLAISSFSFCSSSRRRSSSISALRASFSLASRSYSCRSRALRSVDSSKASVTVEETLPSKRAATEWSEGNRSSEWQDIAECYSLSRADTLSRSTFNSS